MKEVPNSNKRTKQRWMFGTMTDNDEVWFTWLLMAGGSGWGRGRTKTYIMCGGIGWKCRISWQIPNLFFFFSIFYSLLLFNFEKNRLYFSFHWRPQIFFIFLTFIFGRGDAHVEEHFSSLESFHTIYFNTSLSLLNVSIILIKICTFLFLKAFLLAMDVDLKKAFFGWFHFFVYERHVP